ncbi:hypothetical protein B0H14DRAFT_2862282 [Mycena olivaceomarginata]|nr:hypothetical protein B0H14DRAFT_2862282 [Mycena olivaceomarginata]
MVWRCAGVLGLVSIWIWCGLGPGLLFYYYSRMDDDLRLDLGRGGRAGACSCSRRDSPFFVGVTGPRVSFSWWAEAGGRKTAGGRWKTRDVRLPAGFHPPPSFPFLSFSLFFGWQRGGEGCTAASVYLYLYFLSVFL